MTRLLASVAILMTVAVTAHAQVDPQDMSISAFNPEDAVSPISMVEGPGVKIGEGTVLRPVFGLEVGYISNVFYDNSNPQGSFMLRALAQIGTASLGADRLKPTSPDASDNGEVIDKGSFEYRANVRASYDQMLSGNETIRATGGLGVGASLHGLANPMGRFSLGVDEDFDRLIRAANFETNTNTNRDINTLRLSLLYHPRDHAFSGYLYVLNTIDIFERSEQDFADRMFNRVGFHPIWQWLPQTQIYIDASIGEVTGISGDGTKVTSYPLDARAGLATLFTLKTTFNFEAGYTNGFYSRGPSFSAPVINAQLGYRYSPLGRVTLGYQLAYQDSINANYYRDHIIRGTLEQIVSPVVFVVGPELHLREYQGISQAVPGVTGPDTRDDVVLAVIAGVHYNLKNMLAATLDYRFSTIQTDYRYMVSGFTENPSYVRHEIRLGLRYAM
jgi:hypothetical protein